MGQSSQKVFQRKIKELRESLNLTQEKIAKALFLSRSCWSYYETGARTPKLDMIEQIANYFNIDIAYLLKDETPNEDMNEFMKRYLETSKYINKDGCLDLGKLSSLNRIIMIEHYRFLLVNNR